jgi:hypothetical protein
MKDDMRAHPGRLAKKMAFNLLDNFLPLFGDLYLGQFAVRRAASWENIALSTVHLALWACALIAVRRARGASDSPTRFLKHAALLGAVAIYVLPYLPFLTYITHAQYTFSTMPFLMAMTADALRRPA